MPVFSPNDPLSLRLEFEPLPVGSPASVVAHRLVDSLTSGEFAPGSRLPAERALAEQFKVGRSAVREALAALEILGVVTVKPGSGTYFNGSTSELLPATLSWGLMLAGNRTRELLEVRTGLERTAALLAGPNATDEQLAELKTYIDAQGRALDDVEAFIDADARFHIHLARIGGNGVLFDLLQSMRSLLGVWVQRRVNTPEGMRTSWQEHLAIHAGLVARDPAAIDAAMHAHMDTVEQRILATQEADAS